MLVELNESEISLEEVRKAVNEMKSGKAPGLDGFPVECSKKCGMALLELPVRLERKFCYGDCKYQLAWCMYIASVQTEV